MSQLTLHQEEKLNEINFLLSTGHKRILLKGSAGVGKTFLVNELIKSLKSSTKWIPKILASTPTHKALAVLRGKITEDIILNTIHSILQYRFYTNPQTGEKEFVSVPNQRYPPLKGVKYLIIDEVSMIPLEMLLTIEQHAKEQKTTVIFIGDDKQLNPVKENDSPVFLGCPLLLEDKKTLSYTPYPTVKLTEIIRQGKGNPIIELSRNIINIWKSRDSFLIEDKGYLYTENTQKIVAELALVNGTDELKYLAWTNNEVNVVNEVVRHLIYGDNPAKIEQGETIVFNAPYALGKEILYQTNEEIKVETLEIVKKIYPIQFTDRGNDIKREYKIYLINDEVQVIHEDSMDIYKKDIEAMKINCFKRVLSFVYRNDFIDTFADFKYNHAITVHKSQGSTYKKVILNVGDLNRNFNNIEKQRLFYTAITRASDLLILYNV